MNLFPSKRRRQWIAVALSVLSLAAMRLLDPQIAESDFCTYYAAGRLALAGHPEATFDQEAIVAEHRSIHPRRPGPFLYSPLFLPLAMGFAKLPFAFAAQLHRSFLALMLAASLAVLLWRESSPLRQFLIASAFTLCHATGAVLFFQNWTAVLLLLLAVSWSLSSGKQTAGGTVAFALAMHLKPFVALLMAPLVLQRCWRRAWPAVGVAGLLALLVLPWAGLDSFIAWLGLDGGTAKQGVLPYYNNISLPGAIARMSVSPIEWLRPRAVGWGLALWIPLALGLPLLIWGLRHLRDDAPRGQAFCLVWLLIFFPLVWNHTGLLAVLVFRLFGTRLVAVFSGALVASSALPMLYRNSLGALGSGAAEPASQHWVFALPLFFNFALMTALLAIGSFARRTEAA